MTSVEPTAPTFSQSFSIYGYDGNIISTRGLIIKHKETSLRKVLEVNPMWESCLYEVAEAALSPSALVDTYFFYFRIKQ